MTSIRPDDDGPEPVRLRPCGVLDLEACGSLRASLVEAFTAGRPIVVDLSAVTFMDSSALAVLASAHRRGKATRCPLTVVNPTRRVEIVLRVTGLERLLDVRRD